MEFHIKIFWLTYIEHLLHAKHFGHLLLPNKLPQDLMVENSYYVVPHTFVGQQFGQGWAGQFFASVSCDIN